MKKRSAQGRFGRTARWLVAAIALLVSLLICEFTIRLAGIGPVIKEMKLEGERTVYQRSTNPILGFELKAGYRDDRPDLASSYPSTNRWGQRDVERQLRKPATVRRVLVLGDSVVEGHDVFDLNHTLTRRLEAMYPDGSTEVLNFGVSGYCTRAEVELLRVKGLQFEPDVAILVFTENDFDNFNREAYRLSPELQRPGWVAGLFRRSHLFRLAAVRLNLFQYGAEQDPVAWNRNAIGDNNGVQGLRMLAELAKEEGFLPLVAIMPMFDDRQVQDVHFVGDGSGDLVVERLAAHFGIGTIRLSETFRQAMTEGPGQVNPRLRWSVGDGLHLSPAGHEIAARGLYALLQDPPDPVPPTDRLFADPAVNAAEALGSRRPGYGRVHNNNGLWLKAAGRPEDAEREFRLAIELEPDMADAWNNLANLLQSAGRTEEALRHYTVARDLQPWNAAIHYNESLALADLDRREDALEAALTAVEKRPDHLSARLLAGRLLLESDRLPEAEGQFRAVLELDPVHGTAWASLGNLLQVRGDYPQAADAYRNAIRADPSRPGPYYSLTRILARVRNPGEQVVAELLALAEDLVAVAGSADAASLELLTMARVMAGRHEEARQTADLAYQAAVRERLARFLELGDPPRYADRR